MNRFSKSPNSVAYKEALGALLGGVFFSLVTLTALAYVIAQPTTVVSNYDITVDNVDYGAILGSGIFYSSYLSDDVPDLDNNDIIIRAQTVAWNQLNSENVCQDKTSKVYTDWAMPNNFCNSEDIFVKPTQLWVTQVLMCFLVICALISLILSCCASTYKRKTRDNKLKPTYSAIAGVFSLLGSIIAFALLVYYPLWSYISNLLYTREPNLGNTIPVFIIDNNEQILTALTGEFFLGGWGYIFFSWIMASAQAILLLHAARRFNDVNDSVVNYDPV
jgi:hypothetical protein